MTRPARFAGKVALVTGASAGIGLAAARMMASEGAYVAIVGRSGDRAVQAARSITDAGGCAIGIAGNACDPSDARRAVEATVRAFGAIDVLVNGVGGSTVVERPAATVDQLSFTDWQQLISYNLDATFLFCHEVVPAMKERRMGKIVNVSSIASRGLAPSGTAYAASKGGIDAFTLRLARELGPYAINVNAVSPGITLTERMEGIWARRAESEKRAALSAVPLGRPAQPEEQASAICFLASAESNYITGVILDVTGGL